jgi:TetR/AcrR family tetracycline transcriptional repressor
MSSPESSEQSRRPRATLTRDAIVSVAVDLVEEGGVDALTMRAVGQRLGAGAMSLYRHVSGREELLDLVLARLVAEIPDTPATGDWRADAAALAHDVRAALLRRPQLTVLLTSRAGGGGGLATLERALSIFRAAGFSPRDAALANHALGNYVAGAALWEAVGLSGTTGEERRARADAAAEATAALPADAYPSIAWAAPALFAGTARDRFEFGLERLLDGLGTRRAP